MQSTRRMALLGIAAATSADLALGRPAYGEKPAGFADDIDLCSASMRRCILAFTAIRRLPILRNVAQR
jgi:hypothetical protein